MATRRRDLSVSTDSGVAFVSTDAGTVSEIWTAGTIVSPFASGLPDPRGLDVRPAKFSGDTRWRKPASLYVADTAGGRTISQISLDWGCDIRS